MLVAVVLAAVLPSGFPAAFPLPPGHRLVRASSSASGFSLTLGGDILLPRVGTPPVGGASAAWPAPPAASPPRPSSYASLTPPAPFPWPPGQRNASFSRSGDGVLGATRDVSAGAPTYEFYRTALRESGYELREVWRRDARAAVFLGRLAFRGHGQAGHLTVAADGATARVVIRFLASGSAQP